jgi:uncharacterized protein
MKILCVSDQLDPLVYALSMKERFKDVDMVMAAGDLPSEYLGFITSILNKPLLFVLGNHDSIQQGREGRGFEMVSADKASGSINVGFRLRREEDLLVAGLPGSMRYNRGENQYTDFQMRLHILKLIPHLLYNRLRYGRFLDILLTHSPPLGIHDKKDLCHTGYKSFLWFMRIFKPRYLIHGHIHLYDLNDVRVSRYAETTVINAFSRYLLDTGDANVR